MTSPIAHPPETLEGWYASHQILRFTKTKPDGTRLRRLVASVSATLGTGSPTTGRSSRKKVDGHGWTCFVGLVGSTADVMVIHFRDTLDAIGNAEETLAASELGKAAERTYSFLSVT